MTVLNLFFFANSFSSVYMNKNIAVKKKKDCALAGAQRNNTCGRNKDRGAVNKQVICPKRGHDSITSSSGCSTRLAPSSALCWERKAGGFLRRMDPRDESVMLWIYSY